MPNRVSLVLAAFAVARLASAQVSAPVAEAVAEAAHLLNGSRAPAAPGLQARPSPSAVSFAPLNARRGLGSVTHHRYVQLGPGGYPVFGAQLLVHERGRGVAVDNAGVAAARFAGAPTGLSITAEAARATAEVTLGAERYRPAEHLDATELHWAPRDLDVRRGAYRLAHRVDVYALEPLAREYVYVDAATGEVVAREPRIVHAEEPGRAETRYHGTRDIVTDRLADTTYRLYQETARGTVIHTRDLRTGSGPSYHEFVDADNDWTGANPAQDEVARDAFWASGVYHDVLEELLGYHSIDDAGFPLIANVHHSVDMANAFWDGQTSNYGDGAPGTRLNRPLTAVDIVAHEFTHGLTRFSANLIYANESGALNESFSDIYGVATRLAALPERAGDYSIGADVDAEGRGIRSMSDPNLHNHPDTYGGDFYYTGSQDRGGVHLNSGVQNFWFYLLAEGGAGVNDHGRAYAVDSIGWRDALRVAHETLTGYLTPSSDYAAAALASVEAAESLFGPCDVRTAAVAEAWRAVGLEARASGEVYGVASAYDVCAAGDTVAFTAYAAAGSLATWDFGDGTADTGTVVRHVFPEGSYTVTVTAGGCDGEPQTAALPAPVVVDPDARACAELRVPTDGSVDSVYACAGFLADGGGSEAPYGDEESGALVVLHPGGSGGYVIHVDAFDVERDYDFLTVAALSREGELDVLGSYSGDDLAPGDSLEIAADAAGFVVHFASDVYIFGEGFALSFEPLNRDLEARAGFTVAEAPTVLVPTAFATDAAGAVAYDFGDGGVSARSAAPVTTHAYREAGTYRVTQVATTCASTDTLARDVVVAPGGRVCAPLDTAYLTLDAGASAEVTFAVANCGEHALALAPGTSSRLSTETSYEAYRSRSGQTYHRLALDSGQADFDAARLVLRYNGDYDEESEYVSVYGPDLSGSYFDDGDPVNGTWIERELPLPASVRARLRRGETVEYAVDASFAVGVEEGGLDAHVLELQLLRSGVATHVTFAPSPTVAPGDSAVGTLTVTAPDVPSGTYRYAEPVQTNDTALAAGALAVPVVLTVRSRALGEFSPGSLSLGAVDEGHRRERYVTFANLGTEPLTVDSARFGGRLIAGASLRPGTYLTPGRSTSVAVAVEPQRAGELADTLTVFYDGGAAVGLRVTADVQAAGILAFADSLRVARVPAGKPLADAVVLYNRGSGTLSARVSVSASLDTASYGPVGDVEVAPRDSLAVTYAVPAGVLRAGESFEVFVEATQTAGEFRYGNAVRRYEVVAAPRGGIRAPAVVCGAGARFAYDGDGDATDFTWDLGDGTTATGAAVEYAYAKTGTYAVELEACNDVACTRTMTLVEVRVECETVRFGGADVVEACEGFLADSGGAYGEYADGEAFDLRLAPSAGTPIDLRVVSFDVEGSYDWLVVHDGPDATAPVIAEWSGVVAAGTRLRSGPDGLFLRWRSDRSAAAAGFAIAFACLDPEAITAAANTAGDCGAVVAFDAFAARADAWAWDFGDGRSSRERNPRHVYAAAGAYRATVNASGPGGWRDTAVVDVDVAFASQLAVATVGGESAGEARAFAVTGAPSGARLRWTSSEGHAAVGPLAQFSFATAGEHYVDVVVDAEDACPARAGSAFAVAPGTSSSTDRAAADAPTLFPNPTAGPAYLRLSPGFGEGIVIAVYDARGRLVAEARDLRDGAEIPTVGLPAGLYLAELRSSGGHRSSHALIIE